MVRYYGYYSNKSRGMRKKAETDDDDGPSLIPTDTGKKALRRSWARLIQKIYEVDPLVCPKCKGEMRIIGFIDQELIIRKILTHPGLWETRNHDPPPTVIEQLVTYDDEYSQIPPYDDWIQ